ncbi:MAG: DUF3769 domain-containing protein [Xenococcaceae cyanobacterium MO_188.B32]|nr:DUF3769 domain-containing protein [Xenococcaceae cyanobacterium MO_188.B32]
MIPLLPPTEPPALIEIAEIKANPEIFAVKPLPKIDKPKKKLDRDSDYQRSRAVPAYADRHPKSNLHYAYLITQERNGEQNRFELSVPETENEREQIPIDNVETVEVIADRQEYDEQRQVITAEGNVVMRFAQAVLISDRLEVNLRDRVAVAQGNVVLRRGEQVLRGEKFEYYLVQDRGKIINASGEVFQPTLGQDTSIGIPTDETIPDRALSNRLAANQPLTDVAATQEGIGISLGSSRDLRLLDSSSSIPGAQVGGTINRMRFQAETIDFDADGWQAANFRLTNDPFSPPELELRADTAEFRQIEPLVSELKTTKSRIVIDQNFSLPLMKNQLVFDGRPSQPSIIQFGFDGEERGGLFVERSFNLVSTPKVSWDITPQYFLQKAIFPDAFGFNEDEDGGIFDASSFGVKTKFITVFSPRTNIKVNGSLTSLDFSDLEDDLRGKFAFNQSIGNLNKPYNFSFEYNFRERLFNGSIGFQTVFSSVGGIITSPTISLGKTGINLNYQGSIQNINADTDRQEFLDPDQNEERINLTRYQAAVSLGKGFSLWQGQPLPPTREQGLRYSPVPIIPFLRLSTGLTGVSSFYSNGDSQKSLRANIGIQGQIGHFSRSYLDYTGFNITYFQGFLDEESPFLFDRFADERVLSLGITQQIYGPIRLGLQTSLNLDEGDEISTDYLLEYSRRTHNISLRYNPVLKIGSISLRISDFNFRGDPEPFDSNDVRPVVQGVSR